MIEVIQSLSTMFTGCVMCYLIVLFAMIVDFFSGWNKAKQRHEMHTSTAQGRSVSKFIVYEGGMLIASGIDVMIHLTNIFDILSIPLLTNVPIITIFLGIFLCSVEIKSVREKASEKTKKHMMLTEDLIAKIVELAAKHELNSKEIANEIIESLNQTTKSEV